MNAIQYFQWGGNSEKDIYEFDLTFLVKGLLKAYPKARELIRNFSVDNVTNTSCSIADKNYIYNNPKYTINSKTHIKYSDKFDKNFHPTISIEGDNIRLIFPSKVLVEAYRQSWIPDNNIDDKLKNIQVKNIGFSYYSKLLTYSTDGEYTFFYKNPNLYIGKNKVTIEYNYSGGMYGYVPERGATLGFNKMSGFGFSMGNYDDVDNIYYTDTRLPVSFKDIANNEIVIEI